LPGDEPAKAYVKEERKLEPTDGIDGLNLNTSLPPGVIPVSRRFTKKAMAQLQIGAFLSLNVSFFC
jgi:hypothetical protein